MIKKYIFVKKMFLITLNLNEWMVHNWLKVSKGSSLKNNKVHEITVDKEVPRYNKTSFNVRHNHLTSWFNRLPKMESPYCGKRTKRLYLV